MSTEKIEQARGYVNENIVKNGVKGIDGQELNEAFNKVLDAVTQVAEDAPTDGGSTTPGAIDGGSATETFLSTIDGGSAA